MRIVNSLILTVLMLVLSEQAGSSADVVSKTDAGNISGVVTKIEAGSVTVKVTKTVQNGVTRRRVNGRTVSVPKYTTKQEETTYKMSDNVVFRTNSGRGAALADVQAGDTVKLHLYRVSEKESSAKPNQHMEVLRLDIIASSKKK